MTVLQSIIDGIALGAVYALVAIGLALIYSVMRIINFAHGEVITAGGFTLALTANLPIVVSVIACIVVCLVISLLLSVAFRPLRDAPPVNSLIATFAVAFTFQAIWLIAFTSEGRSADVLGTLNRTLSIGELDIRWVTLVMIVVGGLLLLGTALLLNRTSIGLQMRAAASDFRTARTLGVRANTVIMFAFALAGLLAAVVALLLTVGSPLVRPTFGLNVVIVALVGVVVGGIDRLTTATLGGFAIGFVTSVLGRALPADERVFLPTFIFLLVILVLLLRPAGLFAPLRASTKDRV